MQAGKKTPDQKGAGMPPFPISARLAARLTVFCIAAAATMLAGGQAAAGRTGDAPRDLCADAVAGQEKRAGIPDRLLTAISLVESGRWDAEAGKGTAWPWTVTAQGKGRFFPTKAAAIAAVRRLQAQGVKSIDVGCMQVNLHYHPDAFPSLGAAFDPALNAAYAAKFLTALKKDHGSWQRAVQHYHSSTPEKRIPYQRKVYAAWRDTEADGRKPDPRADAGRIRRVSRQIDRDHRAKLSAYKRAQRQPVGSTGSPEADDAPPLFLSSWPPRNAQAQFRAQNLARAWAFGGSARHVRP
jgi:hypothetical protein